MNIPVSFPVAKLLNEKGFPLKNKGYVYNKDGNLVDPCFSVWECEAPTVAEVVMWLWEKNNIWIMVELSGSERFYPRGRMINKKGEHFIGDFKINGERIMCINPTEAYEAAILHCLKNLI